MQNDIKKVLAYSTISQLGYMVMALGVGAWTGAIFHLFTHAFFKACLFLGAGSVSHAGPPHLRHAKGHGRPAQVHAGHVLDVRHRHRSRSSGIFPLAGFWSKDEILAGAAARPRHAYTFMIVRPRSARS